VRSYRSYSPTTVRAYATDLRQFQHFLTTELGQLPCPSDLTREQVIQFGVSLSGRAPLTVRRKLACLSKLAAHLGRSCQRPTGTAGPTQHLPKKPLDQSRYIAGPTIGKCDMLTSAQLDYREILLQLGAERPAADLLLAAARRSSGEERLGARLVPLYRHLAQNTELAFVVNGEARVATPNEVLRMTPGRLLIIERGVYHSQIPAVAAPGHRVLWIHLSRTTAGLVDSVYTSRGIGEFSYHLTELPGRTDVENIGAAIVAELRQKHWGYQHAVAGLLKYLAYVLVRRLPYSRVVDALQRETPIAPGGDERTWEILEAALQFCDSNYRSGITRSDVANAVGYSPRHLGQLMSTHLGHSLADHIQNLRMLEARRLLEQSSLPIHEIASAVGYTDPAHFARAFQRATGLSPRIYRRRLANI
jgi:AraC-like DNA-binding protein